jgi:hypothetical protein
MPVAQSRRALVQQAQELTGRATLHDKTARSYLDLMTLASFTLRLVLADFDYYNRLPLGDYYIRYNTNTVIWFPMKLSILLAIITLMYNFHY